MVFTSAARKTRQKQTQLKIKVTVLFNFTAVDEFIPGLKGRIKSSTITMGTEFNPLDSVLIGIENW